jgi:flagellar biosynthesis/type III secretory pathway protein FliH
MTGELTVNLSKPIKSAEILGDTNRSPSYEVSVDGAAAGQNLTEDLEAQKTSFSQVCQTLNGVVAKLNQFCDKVFAEHREEIAKLSVEIARKILVQKVQNGDYETESIVKEALKNSPTRQDVVVHLNPEDFVQCQKAQQDEPTGALAGIKFVSDPNIGRAECLVESSKGIIESLIDEHLERIGKALKKVE